MATRNSTRRRPARLTGSQVAHATLSATAELAADLFLEYCLVALCEAASCPDHQLDALALEFFDLHAGPGMGSSIWSVAGRMPNRRERLTESIVRAIAAEIEEPTRVDQFRELRACLTGGASQLRTVAAAREAWGRLTG